MFGIHEKNHVRLNSFTVQAPHVRSGMDLFALQAGDGMLLWQQDLRRFQLRGSLARYLISGQMRLFLAAQDLLGAYDMADGHELWSIRSYQQNQYFERFNA